jgi:hypothetical protein
MLDISDRDILPNLSGNAAAEQFARTELRQMMERAYAMQGDRAFEHTQRATAIHEAGHVVVAAASGHTVKQVWIKRKRFADGKAWVGFTTHGEQWCSDPTTPVAHDVDYARNVIAGVVAELLFDGRDFRAGSSMDEIITFRMAVNQIAYKTGASFEHVAVGLMTEVTRLLKAHRPLVERIADQLMRHGTLRSKALSKLLNGIRSDEGVKTATPSPM